MKNATRNTNNVLSNIDINTIIRETVQKELNKYGVVGLTNKVNDGLIQSSSKTNDVENVNVNMYRGTHEVAGNSKTDLNKSVRNDCPDSSVLARHNPIGSEPEANNCWVSQSLTQLHQHHTNYLDNPTNCASTNYLLCDIYSKPFQSIY